jgi:hypothetical protein
MKSPETGSKLEIPNDGRNISIQLLFSKKGSGSPGTLVPLSYGNTLAAFQCNRNPSLGTCDAEVARGGAIGWIQPEERNLLSLLSTRVSAAEHGEGVFFWAECVVETVGNDDMIVFRLWGKVMLAEESLRTKPWRQHRKLTEIAISAALEPAGEDPVP